MQKKSLGIHRARRLVAVLLALAGVAGFIIMNPSSYEEVLESESSAAVKTSDNPEANESPLASEILARLEVKGRAPKTGYSREEFYSGWPEIDGCSLRQIIIKRELSDTAILDDNNCTVISGEYDEPYTGEHLKFTEKSQLSKGIQIDHMVALSDAWQKGAQYLDKDIRYQIATDPLNLIAADASANQSKSDGDAATWLPPNKRFRCQYVARQASVKYKYSLWVTEAEHDAMARVLEACPNEPAVGVEIK